MRSLLNSARSRLKSRTVRLPESGFTVLELIITVVIVGVLAAIVIPLFSNQSVKAIEATLKSDMRNAAVVIMTEASRNQGRMPQWVPNYATKSPDNIVSVVTNRSNQYVFCLRGENPNTATVYYYSSVTGELSETACPSVANGGVGGNPPLPGGGGASTVPTTQQSWDEKNEEETAGLKVLYYPVVKSDHSVTQTNIVRMQIEEHGFGEVRQIEYSDFQAMSQTELNSYDMVITYHSAWSTPSDIVSKLTDYYNQGGKILQDGDDNVVNRNPFIRDYERISVYAGQMDYAPTKNSGLSPAFPYTFGTAKFLNSTSSWRCVTDVSGNGGVAVAVASVTSSDGTPCVLVHAGSNSNGGRWVTHLRFLNLSSGVGKASIDWLKS